jgi:hypothetical protein
MAAMAVGVRAPAIPSLTALRIFDTMTEAQSAFSFMF